jgi:hypothetical protein
MRKTKHFPHVHVTIVSCQLTDLYLRRKLTFNYSRNAICFTFRRLAGLISCSAYRDCNHLRSTSYINMLSSVGLHAKASYMA